MDNGKQAKEIDTKGSAAWADLCGARERDLVLSVDDAPCSLRNKSFPFPGQHSPPGDVDAPQRQCL
ncbi:MAG: hypothetical protein FRX49_07994 [Trebouxia sp. A1-2]|nr:MAG: hypothetical protein FRX49_07994 [Trebouxia sp. A1-2]